MRNFELLLFTIQLITRTVFIIAIGVYNNYGLQSDSEWLVKFGFQAAQLNFNFELERFVASPLFPTLIGMLKIIFGDYWSIILINLQLILSSLSGVFIFKIGNLLFNRKTALLASLLYAGFPLTLWYTNTFSQECIFQMFFIFSIYYLLSGIEYSNIRSIILSGLFFSIAYLTKSHILLFAVFIPLIFFHHFKFSRKTFVFSLMFGTLSLACSLPYGIYNYFKHKQYIISSNGASYQFYLGNTEAGYKTIVDVPDKNSLDYIKMKDITVTAGYFNGSQSIYDAILKLPQKQKQSIFFQQAITWIKTNPMKFIKLKIYDLIFFIMPGVSWRHYSLAEFILSFLLSLPVYLFAYISMIRLTRNRKRSAIPILYIFLAMLLFSTIWYTQNRFRTITLEPFYIIYAAYALAGYLDKKLSYIDTRLSAIAGVAP